MSNKRKLRGRPGPSHVVIELRDGSLVERDLDAYRDGAWLCAECGTVDEGQPGVCDHTEGHCIARVRAAAAKAAPGAVLCA
jgi:hypothetical protein